MADEPHTARLELELVIGCEPIEGRLCAPDGVPREFVGWVAFARVVEAAMREAEGRDYRA